MYYPINDYKFNNQQKELIISLIGQKYESMDESSKAISRKIITELRSQESDNHSNEDDSEERGNRF